MLLIASHRRQLEHLKMPFLHVLMMLFEKVLISSSVCICLTPKGVKEKSVSDSKPCQICVFITMASHKSIYLCCGKSCVAAGAHTQHFARISDNQT